MIHNIQIAVACGPALLLIILAGIMLDIAWNEHDSSAGWFAVACLVVACGGMGALYGLAVL